MVVCSGIVERMLGVCAVQTYSVVPMVVDIAEFGGYNAMEEI